MSSFDTRHAVQNIEISHDAQDEYIALVGFVVGIVTPVIDPQSGRPVGMIPVPTGIHRFPFEKEHLLQLSEALKDAAEKLEERPKQSDLVIPGDASAVDKIASDMNKFRG